MFQKSIPELPQVRHEPAHQSSHDDVETVVGPSVHVEGDFASEGNILVKGTVSGNVKTSKRLTVEDGAKIMANVRAGSAIVSGEIRGNMKVDDKVELTATARIVGDVECAILVVEAGCLIHGRVAMPGLDVDGAKDGDKKRTSFLRQKSKLIGDEGERTI